MEFKNPLGAVEAGATVAVTGIVASQSGDVAAGTNEVVTVTPPVGRRYEIVGLSLVAAPPFGATTGFHGFLVANVAPFVALLGRSSFDYHIVFDPGWWRVATREAHPHGAAAQQAAVQALVATVDSPLRITYENATNATQTVERVIEVAAHEVAA